jgi:hypothetical protein
LTPPAFVIPLHLSTPVGPTNASGKGSSGRRPTRPQWLGPMVPCRTDSASIEARAPLSHAPTWFNGAAEWSWPALGQPRLSSWRCRAATRPSRGRSIRPCSHRDARCNDDGERISSVSGRKRRRESWAAAWELLRMSRSLERYAGARRSVRVGGKARWSSDQH